MRGRVVPSARYDTTESSAAIPAMSALVLLWSFECDLNAQTHSGWQGKGDTIIKPQDIDSNL
eukprot:1610361-Rhodomonas_salina.3